MNEQLPLEFHSNDINLKILLEMDISNQLEKINQIREKADKEYENDMLRLEKYKQQIKEKESESISGDDPDLREEQKN